ncbi:MAG TPA: hypothetical protein PLN30_12280, partial [Ferruginibacter sp.]|nr:hypothetical protein [Ferruginibacter sp.]
MKNVLLPVMIVFMVSCKTKKQDSPPEQVASSQEEKLKADIKKYPDSLLLLENLVQYYREGGNYDDALKTINTAIQKDTGIARLWDMKAILSYENGDTATA